MTHLASYLDEFVRRFDRRRAGSRGLVFYRMLELAVSHAPVRYRELVAGRLRLRLPTAPPPTVGIRPSLERPPVRPSRRCGLSASGAA